MFNLKSPIYQFSFFFVSVIPKKSLLNPRSWRCSPVFSSKDFIIICISFFGLWCICSLFWYDVRDFVWCSLFMHMDFEFFHYPLLKRLSFLQWFVFEHIYASLFLDSGFCSTDLCDLYLLQYHTTLLTVAANNSSIQTVSEFRKRNFPIHFTKPTKPSYHLLHNTNFK